MVLGGLIAVPPALAGTPPSPPPAPTPGPTYQVVAKGLNNPRHLTFDRHGALLVAEAGTGGAGPCIISSEGGQVCYGPTGSITAITRRRHTWRQHRVVRGLPSLAGQVDDPGNALVKGGSATGPSDLSTAWGRRVVVSMGLGADPAVRGRGKATRSATSKQPATLPRGFGTLLTGDLGGRCWTGRHDRHWRGHHRGWNRWRVLADIAGHEARTNPVDGPDSNPSSVYRLGSRYLVADAGGNTVVLADRRGHVRTVATFPDTMVQVPGKPAGTLMPMQAVPTAAVPGPHHALYVSQLTGFPFPPGGASIFRVRPGHAPTPYATGLTNVTDLAFAPDGSLYAVEIASAGLASGGPPIGALVRIPRGGGTPQVVAGGLFAPYGVALHGHDAFVTTGSVLPGGGQVVRIPLSH